MSLIENERTKLLATALNNLAEATIVIGAPVIATLYGMPNAVHGHRWFLAAIVWLFNGLGSHLSASYVLRRLKP